MFVTKSKYDRMEFTALHWKTKFDLLQHAYNLLARSSNKPSTKSKDFSDEEVNTLIRLCHPDKHNGSSAANKMTAKLLSLRNK